MPDAVSLWHGGAKPSACAGCPRFYSGRGFVPGFGELAASLIAIGEQPGGCEAGTCDCPPAKHERHRPFVGVSGQVVNEVYGSRGGMFITNVRKCFGPPDEDKAVRAASIKHCIAAYLQPELDAIQSAQQSAGVKASVVQPIGADAAKAIFGAGSMAKLHATCWDRAERDAVAVANEAEGEDYGAADEEAAF